MDIAQIDEIFYHFKMINSYLGYSMSRTFAIGDIHGRYDMLNALFNAIQPRNDDTVIFLGDYIDRGTDSKGVIDCIRQYQNQCNVITIMGNHEEMMLAAYLYKDECRFWLKHGGVETLQSFHQTADQHGLLAVPDEYRTWLKNLVPYYENEQFIFSHATPVPHLSMEKQSSTGLRWRCVEKNDIGHQSGKTVICGHTAQTNGQVLVQNKIICIDTYAYGGGNLTALQIENGQVWQIDQNLKLKQSSLNL